MIIGAAHTEGSRPVSKRNDKGYVRGYDVRTGKRLWIFHTIPKPGEFGYDTWQDGLRGVHRQHRRPGTDLGKGELVWQIAHGETPDNIRNHALLKGLTIPRTGRQGRIGTLVTKSCSSPVKADS